MHQTEIAAAPARRRMWPFLVLVVAASFSACASGERTLDAVDPQAVSANPTYEQVFAIIQNNCVSCHEGSDDDEGEESFLATAVAAEDTPGLDDCTSIVALRDDILSQIEDNTMPPGALPRLSSEQKLIIRRWVENGAPAPCN
jgi:uncharacterized membrane protein